MKVLMVEPGKSPPMRLKLRAGWNPCRQPLAEIFRQLYPFDDLVGLICNDEGKLIGLPLNRALYDDEGPFVRYCSRQFLIVGLGEEDFTDLPADLIEKYTERFKYRRSSSGWRVRSLR